MSDESASREVIASGVCRDCPLYELRGMEVSGRCYGFTKSEGNEPGVDRVKLGESNVSYDARVACEHAGALVTREAKLVGVRCDHPERDEF